MTKGQEHDEDTTFQELKTLRHYEKKLMDVLLIDAPQSLLHLAGLAQGRELVYSNMLNDLKSMDPSVSHKLMCRYLMLCVYNKLMKSPSMFDDWIEILSSVGGTSYVLSQIRRHYNCEVSDFEDTCDFEGEGNDLIFTELYVPILTEILAGFSSKWEQIAISLWLPANKIKNISHLRCDPAIALKEVILSWVQQEFEDAKPPTLRNLQVALRSKVVGLGTEANDLPEKISIKRHSREKNIILNSAVDKLAIVHQTHDVHVKEGNSLLFEVRISSDDEVKWEWCKEDSHGSYSYLSIDDKEYYLGFDEPILFISVKDLSLEGTYKCKVSCRSRALSSEARTLLSEPIHLTVRTLLDEYKEILTDRYTLQSEIPTDTWPPESSGTYISLALVKQEGIQKAGEYVHGAIQGGMDDTLEDQKTISYDQAMGNLSSGSILLIEGRPGSGKTTFVHKFTQDWARMKKNINHVRLLFLIHLRGFSSDPNVGLRDIIGCYYKDNPGIEDIMKYATKHNGLGLGFILDGLDEYLPRKKDVFVFELIKRHTLTKSVVIIASRPAAAADFRSMITRQVEVLGFLRAQIYDYIEEYPFSEKSKRQGLRTYLDEHLNLLHMCYLPIHASMICFLYEKVGLDIPETETDIYKQFTKFAMLRMLYRSESESEVYMESIEDLPSSRKDDYFNICKLAFEMTLSSKLVMRQAEVSNFFGTVKENELFGLITVDKMALICGFQKLYAFLHLTFQEFLAAYHITSLSKQGQMKLIMQCGKDSQMKQVWKFYCGLVQFHAHSNIFDTLVSQTQHGTLYNIQCSFESQQPSTCDTVIENNSLHFASTFLTTTDFTAIAFVISNAQKQQVVKVVLDRCTIELEGVNTLANKVHGSLSCITHLSYHGHDAATEQLHAMNKLVHFLPCLQVLDVTNTKLGEENLDALTQNFNHPTLEILKVSKKNLFSLHLITKLFKSCDKFINVCLSGGKESLPSLPFCFYCNCQDIDMSFCKLKAREFEVLSADFMINSHCTTRLSLIDCGIDDNAASCLAQGINHCTALEILELNFNFIGNNGASSLADHKIYEHKLHTLDLSCNQIGNKGAIEIAHATGEIRGFKLYLWNNRIENMTIPIIPDADFHTFKIIRRSILSAGAASLSHYIKNTQEMCDQNYTLHSLNITSCDIGGHGSAALFNRLQFGDLRELNVSCNNIESSGACALADNLVFCANLTTLCVSFNNIQSSGAVALSHGLTHCTNLLILDVGHNNIESSGADELFSALKCCTKLQDLNICHNEIVFNCGKLVADVLGCWKNLIKLDVTGNNFIHGHIDASNLQKSLLKCTVKVDALYRYPTDHLIT